MSEKAKIDIALLLPTVPDARDACVQRLTELLRAKEGIETAHLAETKDNGHETICIHYDPNRLSIGEVRDLAGRAGAELDKRFSHLLLNSDTMFAQQALTVEARARKMAGVLDAAVSPAGVVRNEFDREATDEAGIRAGLRKLGVRITEKTIAPQPSDASEVGRKASAKEQGHGGLFGERTELAFAALCGALLLIGWLLSWQSGITPWVSWSFYLGAYIFGGFFTFREATESIRVGRFEIDFLMLVAAIGAATLGEWAEGALLLFLFSIGHSLEHYAMGRAKRAIEALAELAPQTAIVRQGNDTEEVPVEQLRLPVQRNNTLGFIDFSHLFRFDVFGNQLL